MIKNDTDNAFQNGAKFIWYVSEISGSFMLSFTDLVYHLFPGFNNKHVMYII